MNTIPHEPGIYRPSFFTKDLLTGFSGRNFSRAKHLDFVSRLGAAPCNLVQLQQRHTSNVIRVDHPDPALRDQEADALVTNRPGIALGIRTADCVPVFVWNPIIRAAAMIHAGWRGLHLNILERTVSSMTEWYGADPKDNWFYIGPAIRACCYEVGREFAEYFPHRFSVKSVSGKGTMDLAGEITDRLGALGISMDHLSDCGFCTCCLHQDFFSARRGDQDERILSVIQIRSGSSL